MLKNPQTSPFLERNFSVASKCRYGNHYTKTGKHELVHYAFICIPWLMGKYNVLWNESSFQPCGYFQNAEPTPTRREVRNKHEYMQTCYAEQDLTTTPEKTLKINQAIKELGLIVGRESERRGTEVTCWQLEPNHPWKSLKKEGWPSGMSEDHGRLWTPRLIVANMVIINTNGCRVGMLNHDWL